MKKIILLVSLVLLFGYSSGNRQLSYPQEEYVGDMVNNKFSVRAVNPSKSI